MNTAETFAPLPDLLEPRWWTGTPALSPETFIINGNEYRTAGEPLEPSAELEARMQAMFDEVGLV